MPEPQRDTFFTSQPGKGLWSLFTLILNAARLPLWFIYFIPAGLRQDSRWTWRKAVRMRIIRAYLKWASDVEMKTPFDLSAGAEKDQWVTLPPADARYMTGVTVLDSQIKPSRIGGTWYPAVPTMSQKATKVVLHFHGGAYVIGDGRKQDAGFAAKTMLDNAGVSHVFSCQYRLASNPGGRFPAALQDAVTAYTYLLNEQHISAANIIVSGDSAGGNLCLALLRYLADHGDEVKIPNPSCAFLWSPWVDPGGAITSRSVFHLSPNAPKDYINDSFGAWGARCYQPDTRTTGLDNDSTYINFLGHQFPTTTPLWFCACENEMLFFDIQKSYDAFTAVDGNRTQLSIEPASPHDIILVGRITGFEQEAAEAARKAGKFYSSL